MTKHYLISGRVQGVGFRAFTQRAAIKFALTGWVRNLEDGRVEALACGEPERISQFEAALKSGPTHGQVDGLEVRDAEMDKAVSGFTVREDSPCIFCEE